MNFSMWLVYEFAFNVWGVYRDFTLFAFDII